MDRAGGRLSVRVPEPLPETTAVLAVRHAVRAWLAEHDLSRRSARPSDNSRRPGDAPEEVAVALSGGADSTALTAGALAEGVVVHALVVDHGLQPDSARVAAQAAALASGLGAASSRVLRVTVDSDGGMEAAARKARNAALCEAAQRWPVLLGHTLDDQAETVLLGLARGSGGRSIHGMRAWNPPWGRPLLSVRRATTRQMCTDLGVEIYDDPHNVAPEFTRVRLRREVLPLLEDVLGGGVVAALGRTAEQLRDDGDVLDDLAADLLVRARVASDLDERSLDDLDTAILDTAILDTAILDTAILDTAILDTAILDTAILDTAILDTAILDTAILDTAILDTAILAAAPPALRRRVVRSWLLASGARVVTAAQLYAIDELVVRWRGQGGVAVGGGSSAVRLVASRRRGRLRIDRVCRG